MMNLAANRFAPRIGWFLIGLLILILIAFVVVRSIDLISGVVPEQLFEARYLDHPFVTAFHMFTGITFLLFAPLQLNKKFRSKNLRLHRNLGRVLISCALIAGVYGIIAIVVLPVYGGIASETAAWFFGPLYLFSVSRAFWCARQRQIAEHREWIIRAFAIGLGVGTQRVVLIISEIVGGIEFVDMFGPGLWLGFAINLLVAEVWINQTRAKR